MLDYCSLYLGMSEYNNFIASSYPKVRVNSLLWNPIQQTSLQYGLENLSVLAKK